MHFSDSEIVDVLTELFNGEPLEDWSLHETNRFIAGKGTEDEDEHQTIELGYGDISVLSLPPGDGSECPLGPANAFADALTKAGPMIRQLRSELYQSNRTRQQYERQLIKLTKPMAEHPEDYDGPCSCKLCMSYAD